MDNVNLPQQNTANSNKSNYLKLILLSSISIFIAVIFIIYFQFTSSMHANVLINNTHNIIRTANNVLYQITDIELNVRNYLLTNNENFIADLNEKSHDLKTSTQLLANFTRNYTAELSDLINQCLLQVTNLVQLKMNGTMLASDIMIRLRDQQMILDKVKFDADEIIKIETVFLLDFTDKLKSNAYFSIMAIVIGGLLGFSLLFIYVFLNFRSWKKDNQFDALNRNIHDVEDKNKKITLLLEMSDVMLACESIQEVSNVITKYCGMILNFSSGLLYIMHPSKNYLEATASWGHPKAMEQHFFVERCWSTRLGHIYDTHTINKDLVCDHVKKYIDNKKDNENFSYMCIPLRARNDVYGLLYIEIESQHQANEKLTMNERLLINSFTELAALVLANIRLQNSLQHQSIRDHLTSLYNRRYLEEFLTKQLLQSERTKIPIALLMIDIDNFKQINDTYGHDAGDMALKEFSLILLKDIRPGDLASRYGGEEFILVLYNVDAKIAKKRAEKLKRNAAGIRIKHGVEDILSFTISIGISTYPQDGNTTTVLIESADRALYCAKNTGKDKVVLLSEMVDMNNR